MEQVLKERVFRIFQLPDADIVREIVLTVIEITGSTAGLLLHMNTNGDPAVEFQTGDTLPFPGIRGKNLCTGCISKQNVYSRVFRDMESIVSNTPIDLPSGHAGAERIMIVPVVANNKTIAVLEGAMKPSDYSDEDRHGVELFAGILAPFLCKLLNRVQHIEELERKTRNQELTLEVINRLNTSEDVPVLEILELIMEHTRAQTAEISLPGSHKPSFYSAGTAAGNELRDVFSRISHDVTAEGLCVNISDLQDTYLQGGVLKGSLLVLPVQASGNQAGYMLLYDRRKNAFSKDTESLMKNQCITLALALGYRNLLNDLETSLHEHHILLETVRTGDEHLRTVIRNMPAMLVAVEDDGRIILWNRECEKVTGYTAEEILSSADPLSILCPDSEFRLKLLSEWKRSGNNFRNWEWNILCKDGSTRSISWSSNANDNPVTGWSSWAIGFDTTERRKAETDREALISFQQTLLDSIPIPIFYKDHDGKYLGCNHHFQDITGIAKDRIIGKDVSDITPEDFGAMSQELDAGLFMEGSDRKYQTEILSAKDGLRKVIIHKALFHSDDPGGPGIIGTIQDITELVNKEKALKDAEEKLKLVLSHSPMIVSYSDRDHRYEWIFNPHFNLETLEIIGRSDHDIFLPHEADILVQRKQEVMDTGSSLRFEMCFNFLDEVEYYDLFLEPVYDPAGAITGVATVAFEITGRKRAEMEIDKLNRELGRRVAERTRELEAANRELESFSYSVSHDLRAPVRHILGFAEIMRNCCMADADANCNRYLQIIMEAAERMSAIIEALLNFSRMGRTELTRSEIEPVHVLETIIKTFETEIADRSVSISVSDMPVIMGDPALIQVVFTNLVSNAIKFTRNRKDACIEIGSSRSDGCHVIYFRDNGAGFNMKYADRLFGVFRRLHGNEEFEGTGIGLATVQRIVHRHGWKISGEGRPGEGATFYITIPAESGRTP